MPAFVNDNAHAIRVQDEDGQLQRIIPQQVVNADGRYADNLERTAGVRTADDDDQATWERLALTPEADALYRRDQVNQAALARVQARRVSVVGPLQRVVGDDSAPYGPPTGTITTKQALVEGQQPGEVYREAFADHEAVDEHDATDERADVLNPTAIPTEPAVHNTQHDNFVAAGEVAESLEPGAGSDVDDGLGGDSSLEPPYEKANKAQLQAEVLRRGDVEVPDGASKQQLVDALNADDGEPAPA